MPWSPGTSFASEELSKVYKSQAAPKLIRLKGANGIEVCTVIRKEGDDLRKDYLFMHLIEWCNQLFLADGKPSVHC